MSDNSLDFSVIPVLSLKNDAQEVLSKLLNPCKVITNDAGIPRDWRGLAHLFGISGEMIPAFSNSPNPTSELLSQWGRKGVQIANLQTLQEYLETLDRFDVLEDTRKLFESDAIAFLNDSQTNSLSSVNRSVLPTTPDFDVLTVDDAQLSSQGSLTPQFYNAFVLYADEDIDFAMTLIERMENGFGFKLCIKDRDLIGGIVAEHSAMLRLISERCDRLIVILSPEFLQSPYNTFFIDFAQALGIEQQRRKVIPCLYKSCELPPQLSFYFILNYQRPGTLWNFWDKLRDSLRATPFSITNNRRAVIREIDNSIPTQTRENKYPAAPRLAIPCAPLMIKPVENNMLTPTPPTKPPTISITPCEVEVVEPSEKTPSLPTFFHPLGHATSLVDFNSPADSQREPSVSSVTDSGTFVSVSDISNIDSMANSSKKERTKKSKWYQKLSIFNSSSFSLFDHSKGSEKQKKKWHLKKSVPVLAD